MKINLYSIILPVLLLLTGVGFSQSVEITEVKGVGDKVKIDFEVKGLKYYHEVTHVRVYVTVDGKDYQAPLKLITGDVEKIRNGKHQVIWDALKEIPSNNKEVSFDIKLVTIDLNKEKQFFVGLVGNDVTPLGVRFGQLNKTGWYAELRASLSPFGSATYNYNGTYITDYTPSGYYEFTNKGEWQAYSAVVGVTQQVGQNVYLYGGVGYGVENYLIELNEYEYNVEGIQNTAWANCEEYSYSGVEIDAGLLMRYKKLVFGAGGYSLSFKSFGWTLSMAYAF